MTPDSALSRLEDALEAHGSRKGAPGVWRCPAHEDRRASLSVTNGGGKVLVKCHAGCATDAVVQAVGLTLRDLFDDSSDARPVSSPQGASPASVLTRWAADRGLDADDLRAAGFQLRGNEARTDAYRFAGGRPGPTRRLILTGDGAPRWAWSGGPVRGCALVLGDPVDADMALICEGESDAITAHKVLGARKVAVVGLPGASMVPDAEDLCAFVAAAPVVVVATDGDPAGDECARKVLDALGDDPDRMVLRYRPAVPGAVAADLRDVIGHLRDRHGQDAAGRLLTLLCGAPQAADVPGPGVPQMPAEGGVAGGTPYRGLPPATPLQRVDVAALLRTPPPPVPWIVEPLLARGHLTMLTGREGRGKSLLSLAVSVGLLAGEAVAGLTVPQSGRVVVVDAENHPGELHRRLHALGLEAEAVVGRLEVYSAAGLDLIRADHLDALVSIVRDAKPDVVLIDSMRSTWSGKENDSEQAGPLLDRIRAHVARALDVAVLILHHDAKGGGYRGSTAIGAAVDLMWHLEAADGDPEPDRRRLRPGKFRIGREPAPMWLRLYGEPDLGIVEVEAAPPFQDGEGTGDAPVRANLDQRIRAVLADGLERRRSDIARAAGRDPKDRTVGRILDALRAQGLVVRDDAGCYRPWRAADPASGDAA